MGKYDAKINWAAENTTTINTRLCYSTDADIIRYIKKLNNKQGYIKRLIREDLEKTRVVHIVKHGADIIGYYWDKEEAISAARNAMSADNASCKVAGYKITGTGVEKAEDAFAYECENEPFLGDPLYEETVS